MMPLCCILAIHVGQPQTLVDGRGTWRSSIAREPVVQPCQLTSQGFVGDQATQPYHGSDDLAVCIHAQTHYSFWNATYGMQLHAGAVGENLTFDTWDDSLLCVGDVLQVGTATVQISAPRTPCANQARHIGRHNWVQLTIETLRTGMYARVLHPGLVVPCERVTLLERRNPDLTIYRLNNIIYHDYDPILAERFMVAEGLMTWWKERLVQRAETYQQRHKSMT